MATPVEIVRPDVRGLLRKLFNRRDAGIPLTERERARVLEVRQQAAVGAAEWANLVISLDALLDDRTVDLTSSGGPRAN